MLHEGNCGGFVQERPFVIGHEATARVVEIGSSVTNLKPGDIVTMEPALPCGDCSQCREGHYNWCDVCNKQAKGLPHTDGFLQRLYNHPAAFCYKIPDSVSPLVGALCEPLAVIVHASRRARITVGQRILVTGAGTMGLLAFLLSKAYGASSVIIADVNEGRLRLAKELGVDHTVLLERGEDPEEVGKRVKEECGGPVDVTLECTGQGSCTRIGIEASRFGAKVVAVGLGPNLIEVPLAAASLKELDIIGVCRFNAGCFNLAVHFLSRLPLDPIISHMFKLENISEAFECMERGEGVKIMIDCRPNSRSQE
jgi:L-iditol 2-dehydrogenase